MQAPPSRWKVLVWVALGIVLVVLLFTGGANPTERFVGLIGAGAWLWATVIVLRRRERGGVLRQPNEYTGALPPNEDPRYPPEALFPPDRPRRSQVEEWDPAKGSFQTSGAPHLVRCRRGHVFDAGRLPACPVCGDPLAQEDTN